jgi:cell wall-associated NlpC family hydrolase
VPVKAGYLLLAGGGGVFVWSGLKGKSISSVFRQLAGGDSPTGAAGANPIAGVTPATTVTGANIPGSSGGGGSSPAGAAGTMLSFMESQIGKPYLEENPQRFGPDYYDCSGLLWKAATTAGLNMPGGPSDPAAALANVEPVWLSQNGWTAYTNKANIQEGDVLCFTGAAPGPSQWGPIGHIGMASSSTQLCSAYDTAQGVCYTPIAQDNFVVGLRQNAS